jgi:hypothetical protein
MRNTWGVTRVSSSAAYSIVCDHSGTVCDVYMHADKSLESVPGRRCISCRCVEFRFLISAVMSCTTGVTRDSRAAYESYRMWSACRRPREAGVGRRRRS